MTWEVTFAQRLPGPFGGGPLALRAQSRVMEALGEKSSTGNLSPEVVSWLELLWFVKVRSRVMKALDQKSCFTFELES